MEKLRIIHKQTEKEIEELKQETKAIEQEKKKNLNQKTIEVTVTLGKVRNRIEESVKILNLKTVEKQFGTVFKGDLFFVTILPPNGKIRKRASFILKLIENA